MDSAQEKAWLVYWRKNKNPDSLRQDAFEAGWEAGKRHQELIQFERMSDLLAGEPKLIYEETVDCPKCGGEPELGYGQKPAGVLPWCDHCKNARKVLKSTIKTKHDEECPMCAGKIEQEWVWSQNSGVFCCSKCGKPEK